MAYVCPENVPFFQYLVSHSDFRGCESFRAQCAMIFDLRPDLALTQIARFFGCETRSIANQREALQNPPASNGRPPIFSDAQASEIHLFLTQRYNDKNPATICDLQNFCWEEYGIDVLPDTLRHWLRRTPFEMCEVKPIEDARMRVTQDSIETYFQSLERAIQGVPSALVMNLDESGFQKYSDAHVSVVIVPRGAPEKYYPVSRREKRSTFLAAVAADGTHLKPLVIVPRKSIDAELILAGYTPERAVFAHTNNGYINSEIFRLYIENVFIPYINCTRERLRYHGRTVLIMDNSSCHESELVTRGLADVGVATVWLPPHSSDQTQVCDLGIFSQVKSCQTRIHAPREMSTLSQQVIRIVSAYAAACHPLAVTAAFRRAGISNFLKEGVIFPYVTRHTATGIRDVPPEWIDQDQQENRYDKTHVAINGGLWGDKQDKLLEELGRANQYDAEQHGDLHPEIDHRPVRRRGPNQAQPSLETRLTDIQHSLQVLLARRDSPTISQQPTPVQQPATPFVIPL